MHWFSPWLSCIQTLPLGALGWSLWRAGVPFGRHWRLSGDKQPLQWFHPGKIGQNSGWQSEVWFPESDFCWSRKTWTFRRRRDAGFYATLLFYICASCLEEAVALCKGRTHPNWDPEGVGRSLERWSPGELCCVRHTPQRNITSPVSVSRPSVSRAGSRPFRWASWRIPSRSHRRPGRGRTTAVRSREEHCTPPPRSGPVCCPVGVE